VAEIAANSRTPSTATPWSLLLLLMAMTAIGPTTLNIVVPALPRVARDIGADIATLQLTVSLYLLGLAGAQLLMGPLSDRYGRRPVLLAGFALTVGASLLALAISAVENLIVARILQAVGASTGIVSGRAIIRDLFDRDRAAAMIGLVATVMVVVPTLGPLIGGILDTAFGWESTFIFTAVTTLVVLIWAALTLPETRGVNAPAGARQGFVHDFRQLAMSRTFAGYVLVASLGSATFFAFLGGSPYIVVTLMEHSSAEYGVWFAISSVGYMAGNFAASRLSVRFGIDRLIWWGIAVEALGVAAAAAFANALAWGPATIFMPQMLISFGNGLLLPGAISGSVSVRPQAAGTAAGITGCVQMALGAAFTQYAGMLLPGSTTAWPLSVLMIIIIVALAAGFAVLGSRR